MTHRSEAVETPESRQCVVMGEDYYFCGDRCIKTGTVGTLVEYLDAHRVLVDFESAGVLRINPVLLISMPDGNGLSPKTV